MQCLKESLFLFLLALAPFNIFILLITSALFQTFPPAKSVNSRSSNLKISISLPPRWILRVRQYHIAPCTSCPLESFPIQSEFYLRILPSSSTNIEKSLFLIRNLVRICWLINSNMIPTLSIPSKERNSCFLRSPII